MSSSTGFTTLKQETFSTNNNISTNAATALPLKYTTLSNSKSDPKAIIAIEKIVATILAVKTHIKSESPAVKILLK